MATSETSQVKLKLFLDKKEHKVLFAEVGKDMVDFLFYIFSLPLATVTKFLEKKGDIGCLTDLYDSLNNLSQNYIQSKQNKSQVLNPRSPLYANVLPLLQEPLSLVDHHEIITRKIYQCQIDDKHVADVPKLYCCGCKIKELTLVNSPAANSCTTTDGGFVKETTTYMLMDNLEVKPLSAAFFTTLLNHFNIKDVGSLKEKDVVLGVDEGMMLLKASLECKTVLTSVFLGNTGD